MPDIPNLDAPLKRVVLVEDDPAVSSGLIALLEIEGIEVIHAVTIGEGLPTIARGNPDALIVDVGLPDGSGLDLYRSLEEQGRALPAVFISGDAAADAHRQFHSSAVTFLRKPFAFSDLMAALALVIGAGRR